MLRLSPAAYAAMIGHAYDCLPEEACGLLAGDAKTNRAPLFFPCRNAAESSKLYTVDPRDHLKADREAERQGYEIIGVMHSHTHTDAYPSPTDVAQAPVPSWHYVIVSLKDEAPVLRSYEIQGGEEVDPTDVSLITEERVILESQ